MTLGGLTGTVAALLVVVFVLYLALVPPSERMIVPLKPRQVRLIVPPDVSNPGPGGGSQVRWY